MSFQCSICLEPAIVEPVSAPCGHTFCNSCLQKNFDFQVQREVSTTCPVCRFPIDLTANSVRRVYLTPSTPSEEVDALYRSVTALRSDLATSEKAVETLLGENDGLRWRLKASEDAVALYKHQLDVNKDNAEICLLQKQRQIEDLKKQLRNLQRQKDRGRITSVAQAKEQRKATSSGASRHSSGSSTGSLPPNSTPSSPSRPGGSNRVLRTLRRRLASDDKENMPPPSNPQDQETPLVGGTPRVICPLPRRARLQQDVSAAHGERAEGPATEGG